MALEAEAEAAAAIKAAEQAAIKEREAVEELVVEKPNSSPIGPALTSALPLPLVPPLALTLTLSLTRRRRKRRSLLRLSRSWPPRRRRSRSRSRGKRSTAAAP